MMVADGSRVWGRSCYAVDVQGGGALVVRADRRRRRVRWTRAQLGDVAASAGIPVVGALSPRESFTRWVEAPFASPRKALKVVSSLLDVQLPFALEDCVYSVLHVERTPRRTIRLLTAGARRSDIRARTQYMIELGVDPVVLDHEGLALWTQSLEEIPPLPEETGSLRVVVFLGPDRTVVAIGHGREFANSILVREITPSHLRRILLAHISVNTETPSPVSWFWAGPGAENNEKVRALLDGVGPEWRNRSSVHESPALFLARALATRVLTPGELRCNLRTGPEAHSALVRHVSRTKRWAALLLLITGVLLTCGSLAFRNMVTRRISFFDRKATEIVDRLAGFRVTARGEDAIAVVTRALDERKKALSPFKAALTPSLLDVVIQTTLIAQRNGVRLDTFAVSPRRISVTGIAPSYDSCKELLGYLTARGYKIGFERKPLTPRGTIPFTIVSSGGPPDD